MLRLKRAVNLVLITGFQLSTIYVQGMHAADLLLANTVLV